MRKSITVPLTLHETIRAGTAEGRNGWFKARSAEVYSAEKFTPDSAYTEAIPAILLCVNSVRSTAAILEMSIADARALAAALVQIADDAEKQTPEVGKEAQP